MATTVNKKIFHIFTLMAKLADGMELYAQDRNLSSELDVDERTLRRYLDDIHQLYNDIVLTEKKSKEFAERKVTVYRVVDPKKDVSDVLRFFLENDNDLGWVLQLLQEQDPTLLDNAGDAKEAIENAIKKESDIFLFNSRPFEMLQDPLLQNIFKNLKSAVSRHEYRNVDYHSGEFKQYRDVKCLKMIFTQNNWYLAGETEDERFKWFRISFIKNVSYSRKNSYQKSVLGKYTDFFEHFENAMSLHGVPLMTAKVKALHHVARYFDEGMKPFFKSQRFICKHDDGSVDFSIDYTQPLEILLIIRQWGSSLQILEPQALIDAYVKDLEATLNLHHRVVT